MANFDDPLTFGGKEDMVDVTEQLGNLGVEVSDDSFGPLVAAAAPAAAAARPDPFSATADPLGDLLSGPAADRRSSSDTFDPLGRGDADGFGYGGLGDFASYGQLVSPGGDAAASAAAAGAAAAPPLAAPSGGAGSGASAASDQLPSELASPAASTPEPGASAAPTRAAPRGLPVAESALLITVTDPQKRTGAAQLFGVTAGQHVDYLVSTRSTSVPWAQNQVAVRRRFRDFVDLAEVLKARFRGHFVPQRPEKNAVEGTRASDAFVEERRASLQKYLARLAAHPAVGPSEELKLFLETQGELSASYLWQGLVPQTATVLEGTAKFSMQLIGRESKVVDPVAAAQPAARSKDLLRAMKEATHGLRGGPGKEPPPGEAELLRAREGAEEMREQLLATSRAAERLVDRLDRLGAVHGDLGLSLFKVAKLEEAEGGALAKYTGTLRQSSCLISDQKRAAAALVRLGKMLARVTGRSALELVPLHDQLALMPAVLRGLTSREHALTTVEILEDDLESRNRSLAEISSGGGGGGPKALFGGGGERARLRREEELRNEVARLELSIGAAKAEYEKVAAVNRTELVRVAAERGVEYTHMAENLAATQVAAAERVLEVWVQLAGELGAGPAQLAEVRAPAAHGVLRAGDSGGGAP